MRRWGNWSYDGIFAEPGGVLLHRKTGGRVSVSLVRDLKDIPAAMEVAYNLHAIGPLDLIHLAAALIEIVGERER